MVHLLSKKIMVGLASGILVVVATLSLGALIGGLGTWWYFSPTTTSRETNNLSPCGAVPPPSMHIRYTAPPSDRPQISAQQAVQLALPKGPPMQENMIVTQYVTWENDSFQVRLENPTRILTPPIAKPAWIVSACKLPFREASTPPPPIPDQELNSAIDATTGDVLLNYAWR